MAHLRRYRYRRLAFALGAALALTLGLPAVGGHANRAAEPAQVPTYARDVAPILAAKCAGCHQVGGIAPFALTSASEAAAHAARILAVTQARIMPPWRPGADSPPYVGQEQFILTRLELATLARWVRAGAPAGRGAGKFVPRASVPAAGVRTIALAPQRPYRPRASGGGLDDYHCFVLDPKADHDVFVTSVVVRPGQPSVVHHVVLFEASGALAAAADRANARSGGRGWTCFGGPGLETGGAGADALPQWLGAWVPGHVTNGAPRGTGVLLHARSRIVMQVHYNLIHGARADRSRVVVATVPAAGSHLAPLDTMLVPAPVELPCPRGVRSRLCDRAAALGEERRHYGASASLIPNGLLAFCGKTVSEYTARVGDGSRLSTSCERRFDAPMTIYGVAGHMHLRGRDIRVELDPGTPRARTLLHIPHWDFRWQDAYYLQRPLQARAGDVVRVTCRFDNAVAHQPVVDGKPLPSRYVLWGEGTTDEMCLGLLTVGPPR